MLLDPLLINLQRKQLARTYTHMHHRHPVQDLLHRYLQVCVGESGAGYPAAAPVLTDWERKRRLSHHASIHMRKTREREGGLI